MKAVTYHPISDPYHCAYRALSIIGSNASQEYELEKFRILDFYCLFPSLLPKIRKTDKISAALKGVEKSFLQAPYQILPDKRTLFRQLEGVQQATISHLVSRGFLEMTSFKSGLIRMNTSSSQVSIAKNTFENNPMKSFISIVSNELNSITLHGKNGLKARTGLLEFRYDNI